MSLPRHLPFAALALCVLALGGVVWRQHQTLVALKRSHLVTRSHWRVGERIEEPTGLARDVAPTWGGPQRPGWREEFARGGIRGASASTSPLLGLAELMENPRFVSAVVAHQRSMLDGRFGTLFQQLNLSEAELDLLRELLIEKQNAGLEVLMVSRTQAVDELSQQEMRTATARARSEIDGQIRATLGDQRFAQFKAYESSLPQREAVTQLARRLSYTEEPLGPAQAESLVDLLVKADVAVRPAMPGIAMALDPAEQRSVSIVQSSAETVEITDEVLNLASKVLKPTQLAAFVDLREEMRATQQVVELARRNLPDGVFDPLNPLSNLGIQLLLQ